MTEVAIEVEGLRKAYGSYEAVRGISFTVARGEVFAILGPNGAGKTTTVEILEGYRDADAGTIARARHGSGHAAAPPTAPASGSCCRRAACTRT